MTCNCKVISELHVAASFCYSIKFHEKKVSSNYPDNIKEKKIKKKNSFGRVRIYFCTLDILKFGKTFFFLCTSSLKNYH